MFKAYTQPTGITELSSVFLAVIRIGLIIFLLMASPFSREFGTGMVLLLLISIARHLHVYLNGPIADNIYSFISDLVTPCLFGFLLYHALSVYEAGLFVLLASILLPACMYCYLFAREPGYGVSGLVFWGGLLCYTVPFLFVLNYSFDGSRPLVVQYLLTKKFETTAGSDYHGDKQDIRYFDFIPLDSISETAHWVEVPGENCSYYHHSWKYKKIKLENSTYLVLNKRTASNPVHQCTFLLKEINGPVQSKVMTEQQFSRFETGDTFNVAKHRGLLGVSWFAYR